MTRSQVRASKHAPEAESEEPVPQLRAGNEQEDELAVFRRVRDLSLEVTEEELRQMISPR